MRALGSRIGDYPSGIVLFVAWVPPERMAGEDHHREIRIVFGYDMIMQVIETTAHVGEDGMLRLEMPLEQRNQDVRVAVVVESTPPRLSASAATSDKWSSVRGQPGAAGLRVPPPGVDNPGPVEPVALPGPAASQMLVNDRR